MLRISRPVWPLLFIFLTAGEARSEIPLIDRGDLWKYFKGYSEASQPVTAWRQLDFGDTLWLEGATGIGYGDSDDQTVLSDMADEYVSVFLRKKFMVEFPGAVRKLLLSMDYDDGFVAHLNGLEVARGGLTQSDVPFDATSRSHEAGELEFFPIDPSLLLPGENILAIQAHNSALDSSDFSVIPELVGNPDFTVLRGPYLQLGGERTMTIVWNTNLLARGQVEYRTAFSGTLVSPEGEPSTTHVVTLTGLQPETRYDYRVLADGEPLTEELNFKTFLPNGSTAGFRLAAWGDSGRGNTAQMDVAALLDTVGADLAIHTGDLVYDKGQASRFNSRYFRPYSRLVSRINVYNCLGNHDYATNKGQPFLDAFHLPANNPRGSERFYSFDHGNVHFIALDTNTDFFRGSPQYLWLQTDLATMPGFWTVVFHHHSPYTITSHAHDSKNPEMRAHLSPMYEYYGVDLVVVGHAHCYERTVPVLGEEPVSAGQDPDYTDPGGPIYLTTSGGGAHLRDRDETHPNNEYLAVYRKAYHATLFDFSGTTVTGRAIGIDSLVLDQFTLTKTLDQTAPTIFNLEAVAASETTVRFNWETTELADSMAEYGLDSGMGSIVKDATRVTRHSLEVTVLASDREHFYRIHSEDRAGNRSTTLIRSIFLNRSVPFRRGDSNADGEIDLVDAIVTLAFLFGQRVVPPCLEAADFDDDSEIMINDSIMLLQYLFLGGQVPAPPFGECGGDPFPDSVSCNFYEHCGTP